MIKEASSRSSVAGSSHAPSPREDQHGDESPSESLLQTECAPALPDEDLNTMVEQQAQAIRATESQPMTATNSSSSNPSTKEIGAHGSAAPYGTRSRNRTGTSRPNYAEDKEQETDFEALNSPKEHTRKLARPAEGGQLTMLDDTKSSNASRQISGLEMDSSDPLQSQFKSAIPGTSIFSTQPTTIPLHGQSTKKRKANGQLSAISPLPLSQSSLQASSAAQSASHYGHLTAQGIPDIRETNMLSFESCEGRLKDKRLVADDGTILEVNDHVYLVCEPPGEPYYLGRIMEFLHTNNDPAQSIDALRLNWYYRPKDIGRKVNDTRQVFASMHSDISPLTALRGKCQIKHKSEVDMLDDLRKTPDCFWYEKLYDRYIHRFYDVIPTSQVINVPEEVKKVLDERWRYIVVESGRGKELTSAVKSCKRCNKYCASNDSVDCAVCQNTYHMSCVSPPLLKKPSRGFAWACGPCSKAQEKKLEARNTPNTAETTVDGDEEEFNDDEEDYLNPLGEAIDTRQTSPAAASNTDLIPHTTTTEQTHQASLWLFRYLGIHCKVEDALDYDDRIYPRASSRLGPRHQANVPTWPGRPVEYVKPLEVKKRGFRGGNYKKDTKLAKETTAAVEADKLAREKRPKWVMDEPPGYIHRGEDYDDDDPNKTSQLLFKLPDGGQSSSLQVPDSSIDKGNVVSHREFENSWELLVTNYMARAKQLAKPLVLPEFSTNLLDTALQLLHRHRYDADKAFQALSNTNKKEFKEPDLSPAELKRFEDGVAKYGSEWHSIKKHAKTISAADVVRFYYTWKKTDRGKQVWGSYPGRKGKKEAKKADVTVGKLQDDVADDIDDSAFDNNKARDKKRGFQCKFCSTRTSRQWRRAPNTPAGTIIADHSGGKTSGKEKGPQVMVALCWRCAELWRRYAIQWEDIDEVAKKVAQAGGRAWKRKIDEEVLKELVAANEVIHQAASTPSVAPLSADGTPAPGIMNPSQAVEPPRKKTKGISDKDSTESGPEPTTQQKKKPAAEKPIGPAAVPEPPKPKVLPCAICGELEPLGDQHLYCKECRMTVHRNCYGVLAEIRPPGKWACDMCTNDKNPQVSIRYKCTLCPVEYTEYDFVEPPKVSHKKKSEKDRERDRIERENAQKVADFFRKRQEELNKPINPREPLKRTVNNNWVHVTCAIFTPEVKFGNARALEPSEGIYNIPKERWDETCEVCKRSNTGACVSCHSCRIPVHVECARQAGFILGFDIAPVKGSRRDQFNIVNINGEVGTMSTAVWCKEHVPTKTIVHRMQDIVDDTGLNALQLYVRNFKQADLTLTGTVRKATLINQSTKSLNTTNIAPITNRRVSASTAINVAGSNSRTYGAALKAEERQGDAPLLSNTNSEEICVTCGIDISPKWWPFLSVPKEHLATELDNHYQSKGGVYTLADRRSPSPVVANGGGHIALAVAALHEDGHPSAPQPAQVRCHKCHIKNVQNKPSPHPMQLKDELQPHDVSTTVGAVASGPEADIDVRTHYPWAGLSTFPPSGPYTHWSQQSPVSPGVNLDSRMNGSHSPGLNTVSVQPLNAPLSRQSLPSVASSLHQNGHAAQGAASFPLSPRRIPSTSTLPVPNGAYSSHASTRPTQQQLSNGAPPSHLPEHTFSHGTPPVAPRSSLGPSSYSPQMRPESRPLGWESNDVPNNNVHLTDNRINGGASASPSLRNLLS